MASELDGDGVMAAHVSPLAAAHHGFTAHEVMLLLETRPDLGLSEGEAEERLRRYGANELPAARRGSLTVRIARQFNHPLIYVLLVAGSLTAVLKEYVESSVILGVVAINAVVGFLQEAKAEMALENLRSMVQTTAKVVRDGYEHTVASCELVPGDLVLLMAGDKVPADIRLTKATELRVNESTLTGESAPVPKDEMVLPVDVPVADRRNMVYSGTLVTGGSGVGVVVATGSETELGEIHRLVGAPENLETPLTQKLAAFSEVLTFVIVVLAALTFGVGLLHGNGIVDTFTAAVALAVGSIPEGLPAAMTIMLAIGVTRMARRHAIIRRLPAVETLGSITVICTDKTGTLTENQMTVQAIWTITGEYRVTGVGYAPTGSVRDRNGAEMDLQRDRALWWSLVGGATCGDASLVRERGEWAITGDPTEGAMLVAATKAGLDQEGLEDRFPRLDTIPFSSARRYMATLHRDASARDLDVLLVKGAIEQVLDRCDSKMEGNGARSPLVRSAVLAAAERMANQGLRILATAIRPIEGKGSDSLEEDDVYNLTMTGFQAMRDPPREAATAAIAACRAAGVNVKMITGDHAITANAIAREIGLLGRQDQEQALTGSDLSELPADEFSNTVDLSTVFARVSPEQKLRLVEGLQSRGHVVAMTGDGVNDAPALRQADIGVAMGKNGTEVAKDASDMVLVDDDFATIEAAVEEGRGVFDNLTKFITWTLPTNIGEGLLILSAIVLNATLPMLPMQILWVNMTTSVALGLMLAFEPKESGIMSRPPRDPAKPLLTGALSFRILLVAALMVGGSWWLFEWERSHGARLAEARTAAMNVIVVIEALYLFTCRSLAGSIRRLHLFSNPWIILGVGVQAVVQAVVTYVPQMNAIFATAPIDPGTWLRILIVAAVVSAIVAVDKRIGALYGR